LDLDKFEKTYAYGIRYNYGKEGARINYSPYSCLKIIQTVPGPDETHGCPYRIYEPATLRTKLHSYGCGSAHIQEIATFAQKGHYQLACGRYFEVTHNEKLMEGINHPNHYFELSQILMGDRQPKVKPTNPGLSRMSDGKSNKKGVVVKRKDNTVDFQGDRELWDFSQVDLETLTQTQEKKPKMDSIEPNKVQKVEETKQNSESDVKNVLDQITSETLDDWGDDDDFDMSVVEGI
jgi:DNA primase large subunit